jgi:hypothetical protein
MHGSSPYLGRTYLLTFVTLEDLKYIHTQAYLSIAQSVMLET